MKIRYFVRIALVFLVALSLVLTWAIWTMPNKIENSSDSNSKKTGINSTLQENEIFRRTVLFSIRIIIQNWLQILI